MTTSAPVEPSPGRPHGLALLALPLLILISVVLATEYVVRQSAQHALARQQQDLLQQASSVRVALESELNAVAFLANGIESYIVARKGLIDPDEIEPMLALLFERGRHFRNIGIAPGNRIRFIYPLAGNEAALGLRYEDNPSQWPAVQRMMQDGRPVLAGPLELLQGGQALIYRSPIFIDGTYWGLLSTVIDAVSVLKVTEVLANNPALRFALRNHNAASSNGAGFPGDPAIFSDDPLLLDISVPGGRWQMAVAPSGSPSATAPSLRLGGYALGLLAFLLSALALRYLLQKAQLARMEVAAEDSADNLLRTTHLLRSVLGAATRFSIIATDRRGVITVFNRGAELMLGYDADEMIGKRSPQMLHLPEEITARSRELTAELGRPVEGFRVLVEIPEIVGFESREWTYRDKSGRQIPVALTVTALKDPDGEISGYLGVAEDISERKHTDMLKNEFIATVSHELRTPLTAISGAIGLVASGRLGALSERMEEMLRIAVKNSQRLNLLINDLLDMEKLVAGKLLFDMRPHALRPLVEQSVRDNQTYADAFDVELRLAPGADAQICTDADRLQQVMANLLSNAAKFSPAGSQVDVVIEPHGDVVRVSVRDRGPGIPESFRKHIFQKFSQADASDTRSKGGTGLGLAISRELVERMGGSIGFETVEGQGTCFHCELPLLTQGESR